MAWNLTSSTEPVSTIAIAKGIVMLYFCYIKIVKKAFCMINLFVGNNIKNKSVTTLFHIEERFCADAFLL